MKKYQTEIDKLQEIHNKVKSLIDQYSPEKRELLIFDKWSLKDVVAHLSAWMEDDLKALDNLMEGKKSYWEPDVEEFNERGVESRKRKLWEEIYFEFTSLIDKLIDLYRNLPVELQNKKVWQDREETAMKFLEEDINHWEEEHIPSLESNLK